MTTTTLQHPTSTHPSTDKDTTRQLHTNTDEQFRTNTATTKTKRSHLCITIRGAAPAFGRQRTTRPAVDLGFGLIAASGWWSWC